MLTFEEAIGLGEGKRHAFLGNGFSIACRPDIFTYGALFDRADFNSLSHGAKSLFERLETTDFERVIEALRSSAAIVDAYPPGDNASAEAMLSDAELLKETLVTAVAGSHPALLSEISDDSYSACRRFLSQFDTVYTLNYDLLTYWAIMQQELEPKVKFNDGFRTPEDGVAPYVVWELDNNYSQNFFYLHGALHFYDAGSELQKYTWVNTGKKLTDQIRSALSTDKFPIFVSEGSSEEKLTRIKHNAYLARAFRSFSSISGSLFVYGHSLARNDEHFLSLIERGKIKRVFVGLYGDESNGANQAIIRRANLMADRRATIVADNSRRNKLRVDFFDAATAKPWG